MAKPVCALGLRDEDMDDGVRVLGLGLMRLSGDVVLGSLVDAKVGDGLGGEGLVKSGTDVVLTTGSRVSCPSGANIP